ncbi:MAG: hypothetical protein K0Q95_3006 [Bacteroidota bacterium]|jgi:hypothetical protein|nr:hypothetical protein [Bacteroidota bacterium]
MKISKFICAVFLLSGFSASANYYAQQDSLGLPGDNLDLYGVLDLFKKSENPEEFEKALNKEENKLNNLDLNHDNKIDYIYVIDKTQSDAHALILRVATTETQTQDVAVIEIEKKGDENAVVQIVGDEALYGKDYIVEPSDDTQKAPEKSVSSNNPEEHTTTTTIVNVYHWPAVRYIYRPAYVVYVSPWGWSHYPVWWTPWRPIYWAHYHPHWHPYHMYHRRVYTHRAPTAHNMYHTHRASSNNGQHRNNNQVVRPRAGRNVGGAPRESKPVLKPRESRPTVQPRESKPRQGSQPRHNSQPRQKGQGQGRKR